MGNLNAVSSRASYLPFYPNYNSDTLNKIVRVSSVILIMVVPVIVSGVVWYRVTNIILSQVVFSRPILNKIFCGISLRAASSLNNFVLEKCGNLFFNFIGTKLNDLKEKTEADVAPIANAFWAGHSIQQGFVAGATLSSVYKGYLWAQSFNNIWCTTLAVSLSVMAVASSVAETVTPILSSSLADFKVGKECLNECPKPIQGKVFSSIKNYIFSNSEKPDDEHLASHLNSVLFCDLVEGCSPVERWEYKEFYQKICEAANPLDILSTVVARPKLVRLIKNDPLLKKQISRSILEVDLVGIINKLNDKNQKIQFISLLENTLEFIDDSSDLDDTHRAEAREVLNHAVVYNMMKICSQRSMNELEDDLLMIRMIDDHPGIYEKISSSVGQANLDTKLELLRLMKIGIVEDGDQNNNSKKLAAELVFNLCLTEKITKSQDACLIMGLWRPLKIDQQIRQQDVEGRMKIYSEFLRLDRLAQGGDN